MERRCPPPPRPVAVARSRGSHIATAEAAARLSTANVTNAAGQPAAEATSPATARPQKPPMTVPLTYADVPRPTRAGGHSS